MDLSIDEFEHKEAWSSHYDADFRMDQSTYQSLSLHHQDRHYTWERHPMPDVLTTRMKQVFFTHP